MHSPQALRIHTVVSFPFDENSYIVHLEGDATCVLIDPGLQPAKIDEVLAEESLQLAAILNTHGHADHIGGNHFFKEHYPDCPLIIGRGDAEKLTDADKNLSAGFGIRLQSPPADQTVDEGETLAWGGLSLEVINVPGHSQGHIAFVWKSEEHPWQVFGGDVLFHGGMGRHDFPDGDLQQLLQTIHQKFFTMPSDTVIWPGHGPGTTIGEEKEHNPFVGKDAGYLG